MQLLQVCLSMIHKHEHKIGNESRSLTEKNSSQFHGEIMSNYTLQYAPSFQDYVYGDLILKSVMAEISQPIFSVNSVEITELE